MLSVNLCQRVHHSLLWIAPQDSVHTDYVGATILPINTTLCSSTLLTTTTTNIVAI